MEESKSNQKTGNKKRTNNKRGKMRKNKKEQTQNKEDLKIRTVRDMCLASLRVLTNHLNAEEGFEGEDQLFLEVYEEELQKMTSQALMISYTCEEIAKYKENIDKPILKKMSNKMKNCIQTSNENVSEKAKHLIMNNFAMPSAAKSPKSKLRFRLNSEDPIMITDFINCPVLYTIMLSEIYGPMPKSILNRECKPFISGILFIVECATSLNSIMKMKCFTNIVKKLMHTHYNLIRNSGSIKEISNICCILEYYMSITEGETEYLNSQEFEELEQLYFNLLKKLKKSAVSAARKEFEDMVLANYEWIQEQSEINKIIESICILISNAYCDRSLDFKPLLRPLKPIMEKVKDSEEEKEQVKDLLELLSNDVFSQEFMDDPTFLSSLYTLLTQLQDFAPCSEIIKLKETLDSLVSDFQEDFSEISDEPTVNQAFTDMVFYKIQKIMQENKEIEVLEKHMDEVVKSRTKGLPLQERDMLIKQIIKFLKMDKVDKSYGHFTVENVGSSANGLWSPTSDIDLVINFNDDRAFKKTSQHQMIQVMKRVRKALRNLSVDHQIEGIFFARVPILRFEALIPVKEKGDRKQKKFRMKCDISINNLLGIANSRLIRLYAEFDQRCHILMNYVKHTFSQAEMSDAQFGYFSSYAMNLMIIAYLQSTDPPVLPNLQDPDYKKQTSQTFRALFREDNKRSKFLAKSINVSFCEDLEYVRKRFKSENKSPVSQLFLGFMNYYFMEVPSGELYYRDPRNNLGFHPADSVYNPSTTTVDIRNGGLIQYTHRNLPKKSNKKSMIRIIDPLLDQQIGQGVKQHSEIHEKYKLLTRELFRNIVENQ